MYISLTNTIGAIRTAVGIIRKNLQLWLDFNKSEVIGSEEVVNGDFEISGAQDNWNLNSNWTISGGFASTDGTANSDANQSFDAVIGSTYEVSIYINDISQGGYRLSVGAGRTSYFYIEGLHTEIVTATSTDRIRIEGAGSPIGDLEYISVKEVTQLVKDKSPNTNNAKLFTGKALSFDGNDYVDCGDVGANKTLAFWFNSTADVTSTSPAQRVFGFNDLYYGITSGAATGSLEGETLTVLPDGVSRTATTMNFDAGVWYRVVVIWNATSSYYDIYVNGDLKTDLVSGTHTLSNWDSFFIGKDNAASQIKFNGSMSDVQIYNVALSESDITFDYNNPNLLAIDNPDTSLVVTDLKAYWALNEGDGLVAYDSGSTLEEDVVQNGDFSELGSEEITNGDFATDTDWNKGTGITIGSGVALFTSVSSGLQLSQDIGTEIGKTYKIKYDIISRTEGAFSSSIGGVLSTSQNSAVGSYEDFITATSTGYLYIRSRGITTGSIDNISVKQVDPNDDWTLGGSWSFGDNVAEADGSSSSLNIISQNLGLIATKNYKFSFQSNRVSGTLFVRDDNNTTIYTLSGGTGVETQTFNLVWNATGGALKFYAYNYEGSITNITVKEITPSDHGGINNGATYVDKQPTIPQLGMMDWAKGSNLIEYSEDFSDASWDANSEVIIDKGYSSPNGINNATKLTKDGGNAKVAIFTSGTPPYSKSIYARTTSGTGTIFLGEGSATGGVLSNITEQWQRFEITNNNANFYAADFRGASTLTEIIIWGAQLEQSSSAGNYILTDGAAAIDVTTIQNPTNKGYDILGNALRLRENAFNLDGSGYAEVAISSSLSSVTNGTVQFWLKNSSTSNFVLFNNDGDNYLGAWNGNLFYDSESGTITQYADSNSTVTSVKITDGSWHMYTFTGVDLSGYAVLDISNYSSSFMVDSIIDDIVVYDRVLTSKEITNNYKFGLRTHS